MKRTSGIAPVPKAPANGPSPILRRLIKVGAWTLAVPALCAAVLVGGAAPLYLLLPEAAPSQKTAVAAGPAAAAAKPAPNTPTSTPAKAEVAEAIDTIETRSTSIEPVADEEGAEPPVDTAAVVPTPRPAMPRPYTPPSSAESAETVAAVEPQPPREVVQPDMKPPKEIAPIDGRRTVIRTAAKLRAAPQGAEIGVLRDGAEIVVGRCDSWCEVSADGKRGYVHASLVEGTRQSAERATERREEQRRPPQRSIGRRDPDTRPALDERPRYERREARRWVEDERLQRRRDDERRFEERAYRRGVDPDWLEDDRYGRRDEPDWYVEDGPAVVLEGPVYYDDPYR